MTERERIAKLKKQVKQLQRAIKELRRVCGNDLRREWKPDIKQVPLEVRRSWWGLL